MAGVLRNVRLWLCLAAFVAAASASAQAPPTSANDFARWRTGFIASAIAAGHEPATLHAALDELTPDPRVIEIWNRHSDFAQPLWAYLSAANSSARIATARVLLAEHAETLGRIKQSYGVNPEIVVAVWGMETRFGEATLDFNAVRALATLSFISRRALYANELLAAFSIIERGDASVTQLKSSWDGGLGQPQLMPSTFLTDAEDADHDDRSDIWFNSDDALESIAHVLASRGWRRGEPILIEARLPADFDWASAATRRTLRAWTALGVRSAEPIDNDQVTAQIWRPERAAGRAYLRFSNFDVLRRYNGALRYGLAAAFLARAARGETLAPWPRPADALNDDAIIETQRLLTNLHYDVGAADGIYGERTWRALGAFARTHSLPAPPYPTQTLLNALQAASEIPASNALGVERAAQPVRTSFP